MRLRLLTPLTLLPALVPSAARAVAAGCRPAVPTAGSAVVLTQSLIYACAV